MVHESKTDCPVIGVLAQAGVKICVEIVVLNLESEFWPLDKDILQWKSRNRFLHRRLICKVAGSGRGSCSLGLLN